jgi:hypothetical protein
MLEKEFIKYWIDCLTSGKLKIFPDDFNDNGECNTVQIPDTSLLLGNELFGHYELMDISGNSFLITDDLYYAKFILYSNRMKNSQLKIPLNKNNLISVVRSYESHLDEIIKEIEKDFKFKFPASNNSVELTNKIFTALNIKRY